MAALMYRDSVEGDHEESKHEGIHQFLGNLDWGSHNCSYCACPDSPLASCLEADISNTRDELDATGRCGADVWSRLGVAYRPSARWSCYITPISYQAQT